MNTSRYGFSRYWLGSFIAALMVVGPLHAQTCIAADDMGAATKAALIATGNSFFGMAAQGDSASLRQKAIPILAADFSGVERVVTYSKSVFGGAHATPRPPYLLKAEGTASQERAEFLCGVFGANGETANSAKLVIPNLPPGEYGIVILDILTATQPYTVSFVLQRKGADWKLGGFFVKATQTNGHDGDWFATKARSFKAKGQTHNAWLYFVQAHELMSSVPFMHTQRSDQVYEEAQAVKPVDLSDSGTSIDLNANGNTYKLTTMLPLAVGKDLDVVVKYGSADVSNATQTFRDNTAVMKALVTRFPELRDAFSGVVVRAVEPSGRDYGSLFSMSETASQPLNVSAPGPQSPSSSNAVTQSTVSSLSIADVEHGLKAGVSNLRMATLVKQYGVDFDLTDATEKQLRAAGANDELLLRIARSHGAPK